MKELVELQGVRKSYQKMVALNDVSLRVTPGITGLLGPNGAGKSTLIKVLLGLVRTSSGTGHVLGHPLGRGERAIRAEVGYMPEDDCYITGMTGIEMVRFSAMLAGLPPIEALRRSHEILDFCGVNQERYRSVEGYSTGMRQKVKFAAAIVHDPRLLILDEPTSGLDPDEREALLNRVRVLCERFGKSAIISTHILPDVQAICDQVIILAQGSVRVSERIDSLNDSRTGGLVLSVLQKPDSVADVMNRNGIPSALQADGTILLHPPNEMSMGALWQVVADNQIQVRSLTPTKTSIEEIFMAAIREERGKNAHT